MKQTFSLGKMLGDPQVTLNAAMELADRYKDDSKMFSTVTRLLWANGIGMRKLPNGIVVAHWKSNPLVDDILNADLGQLPEFLTDEEYGVRLLAMHRLNLLTG